jgi:hypothetical protein
MEDIKKDEQVIKAMDKVKKDKVEISINPRQILLEYSNLELKKLEAMDVSNLSKADLDILNMAKENYSSSIKEYAVAKIEGIMIPLKYLDLQVIKNGVLEALKYNAEFNWDEDIKIKAMIREEHTLTVYLSLKKKEDVNKRYYSSLEEIAKEPESAIEELYLNYIGAFVLSEQERKNS